MQTLNFNSESAKHVFEQVVQNLPKDVEVHIIGGSIRNAIFRHFFNEALTQRDYDQVVTEGSQQYIDYLKTLGFYLGNIDRPKQKIYVKDLLPNPPPEGYTDSIVFDIHTMDGTTIMENLKYRSGFTINGFGINIKDVLAEDWIDKIVMLPNALEDMKNKRLRVNLDGYKEHAPNLFACIRFMSAGFTPPSADEIMLILKELPRIEHTKYQKNITKVYDYVGGEQKARELASKLNLPVDIFNEEEVKSKVPHL